MAEKFADGTPDVVSAIVAERWQMASTRLQDFVGDDRPSWINSEAMEGVYDNLRDLAYRMGGPDPSADHEDEVERVFESLLLDIETELRDMASRIERGRMEKAELTAA